MNWNDGHIWRTNAIRLSDIYEDIFEYKFIIVDSSGQVERW